VDPSNITYVVEQVSSETASKWLLKNTRNRPISQSVVKRYMRDMESGAWNYAADPIRFDTHGNLIDGQHRLAALSELSDISLQFLVIRGLDTETQLVMDQGRKRNAGQQLALLGVKNSNNIAAAVKLYIIWDSGMIFKDRKTHDLITSAQIEAWVSSHAWLVEKAQENFRTMKNIDAIPSITLAAFFKFCQIDPNDTIKFINLLESGAGLDEGSPILALIQRQRKIRREGLMIPQRDMLSFYILAWNAWRDGKSLTKFQRPRGGSWTATSFPIPR
jgi:hypothetical protein